MDRKIIKAIRGHDILKDNLEEACQRAREIGIESLQLVLEKSIPDFKQGSYSDEYAKSIKDTLGDIGVCVLGSYINPSEPDDDALRAQIEKFKEKIRFASVINPTVVGTETGMYIPGETHSEAAYQRVLKTLRELSDYAKEYGVCLGVEGVHLFVINSPQMIKRLLGDIENDNIKVIFDPLNLLNMDNYKEQDKIITDMFDMFREKIVAIHIKDFVIEDGKIKGVAVGEGILNYKLIFEKMHQYGLNIPMVLEGTVDDDAQKAYEYLISQS